MGWQSSVLEDPALILFHDFPAIRSGHSDWSTVRGSGFPWPTDHISPEFGPGSFPMNALCILLTIYESESV